MECQCDTTHLVAGTACGSEDPTVQRTKANYTKPRRENDGRNCVSPADRMTTAASTLKCDEKEKEKEADENMAIVNKRAKDERSLWPYTNLRLLYWPRINHRGHWGCPSRTLAQKTIHTKNPQMNCVHLQVPVWKQRRAKSVWLFNLFLLGFQCPCYTQIITYSLLFRGGEGFDF